MELRLDENLDVITIDSISDSAIIIKGIDYKVPILVYSKEVIHPWGPLSPQQITKHDIDTLCELNIELFILGSDLNSFTPEPTIFSGLMAKRIGYEVMSTHAACSTYNIVATEGREVAVALFPGYA